MCRWRNFSEIIHKHNSRTRLGVYLDKEAQIHQGKQPQPEYRVKTYKCEINGLIKKTIDRANRAISGIEKQEPPSKNKKKQIFKASEETSRFKCLQTEHPERFHQSTTQHFFKGFHINSPAPN
jgi:hypothetical protein